MAKAKDACCDRLRALFGALKCDDSVWYLDHIQHGDPDLQYLSYSCIWLLRHANGLEIKFRRSNALLRCVESIKGAVEDLISLIFSQNGVRFPYWKRELLREFSDIVERREIQRRLPAFEQCKRSSEGLSAPEPEKMFIRPEGEGEVSYVILICPFSTARSVIYRLLEYPSEEALTLDIPVHLGDFEDTKEDLWQLIKDIKEGLHPFISRRRPLAHQ